MMVHSVHTLTGEGAHTVIMTAINQFMEDTCVKFKKKEPADFDHLYFYPGTA